VKRAGTVEGGGGKGEERGSTRLTRTGKLKGSAGDDNGIGLPRGEGCSLSGKHGGAIQVLFGRSFVSKCETVGRESGESDLPGLGVDL